jgi:ElaB/YqjD/DUF883 family membrane-anchored ribosome-binding protein
MAEKNDQPSSAELERQLAALREDFNGIATLLRDMAEDRAGQTAARVRETADNLTKDAARRGHEARDAVDSAVKGNPVASLGIAAVLGFALGALTRR